MIVKNNIFNKLIYNIKKYCFYPFDSYILFNIINYDCYLYNPLIVVADIRDSDIHRKRELDIIPNWNIQEFNIHHLNILISVIIPVIDLNNIEYSLESIYIQSYDNLELVLILNMNNIKLKNSLIHIIEKILIKYSNKFNKKIKYIHNNSTNIVNLINIGIEKSNGKYINIHYSNCLSIPDRYLYQINNILENNTLICYSNILYSKEMKMIYQN